MRAKDAHADSVKEELRARIDALALSDEEKELLRARWLDQVVWMEGRARRAQRRYYAFRLTTVVGAVILPALIAQPVSSPTGRDVIRWIAFGLSLVVGVTGAVEHFFRYGERWRHYRQTVEWLKIEGWHFFLGTGAYERFATHADGFRTFSGRVEDVLQQEVAEFFGRVVSPEGQTTRSEKAD